LPSSVFSAVSATAAAQNSIIRDRTNAMIFFMLSTSLHNISLVQETYHAGLRVLNLIPVFTKLGQDQQLVIGRVGAQQGGTLEFHTEWVRRFTSYRALAGPTGAYDSLP